MLGGTYNNCYIWVAISDVEEATATFGEMKFGVDVSPHACCQCRGKCNDRCPAGKKCSNDPQGGILLAKIGSPVRNAMSFVYYDREDMSREVGVAEDLVDEGT